MAGFHLNFSMVALYETRLSLVTFEFCDGGVVQICFVSEAPFLKLLWMYPNCFVATANSCSALALALALAPALALVLP